MKILICIGCWIFVALLRVFVDYAMVSAGYIPGVVVAVSQFIAFWFLSRLFCKKWDQYRENESVNNEAHIDLSKQITDNKTQVHFCRICGTKFIDQACFCRKCGTQVVKE